MEVEAKVQEGEVQKISRSSTANCSVVVEEVEGDEEELNNNNNNNNIHSLIYSFIHSFIHSFNYSFLYSILRHRLWGWSYEEPLFLLICRLKHTSQVFHSDWNFQIFYLKENITFYI